MRILASLRERFRHRRADPIPEWPPGWDRVEQPYREDAPTITYEPHGIDTPETLAAIRAKAEADARTAQACAETEQWGTWDEPGAAMTDIPAAELPPPPPMPYPGDLSSVMVHQITYPDPSDLSYDKARQYREMLRRVGVATGTHTSLEDTGVWALPALEPGDGTGAPL